MGVVTGSLVAPSDMSRGMSLDLSRIPLTEMTELTKPNKPSMPSMVRTFRKMGVFPSMPMTLGEKGVFSANVKTIDGIDGLMGEVTRTGSFGGKSPYTKLCF